MSQEPNFESLWHGLPWNGLFWVSIVGLLGGSVYFGYGATIYHREHQDVYGDQIAIIEENEPVRVVLVLNGDEIMVEKESQRAKVRILGIRAFDPVINEKAITGFGEGSVRFLESRLLGKDVRLRFDRLKQDSRGRYLAYVFREGVDIGEQMVQKGIAFVYTEFETRLERDYLGQEIIARKEPSGVWTSKRAQKRILALRHDWSRARQKRDGKRPADPLTEANP